MDIYLKKDYMQYTGSFKERGARYTLLMLSDEQKKKGALLHLLEIMLWLWPSMEDS